jgi:hypothetical protein|tara:strand:- start:14736 stop:15173 length:438 start_codon:yes stop_codon:yes gene_type:complete
MSDTATFSEFRAAFRRSVACWQSLFDEGRTGTEYAIITPEEREVFGIQPARYAAMVALFEAYEAVKNICDMGNYEADLCAAMRDALDLEDNARITVEEMQALGQVVGVSYREAFAMFYKVHFWEIRSGQLRYKDETNEGEDPIPF